MNLTISPEIREVTGAQHSSPALTIILPLEPHISLKAETAHALKIATDKAERELRQYYSDEQCEQIMQKLGFLIANLDIPVKKKGIAIYASPVFAKVLYLDSPVEEKLIIDESFEIRDLLYSEKQYFKFILLILSGQESKVFLGDPTELTPLSSDIPESIFAYVGDPPERVSNFSDMTEHKQITLNKFLYHIDEELDNLINEYHLPVLVLGTERILGQFKKLSKHTASFIDYVEGNYESNSIAELTDLIRPYLDAWKIRQQKELLTALEEAIEQQRVATGIWQVWQEAHSGKGKLLIVEKNYRFSAQRGPAPSIIEPANEPNDHFAYIRDAVNEVLEKVLESGGDVEFTEDGKLNKYDHIALIKYYE
jgi:hypothetical protein